MRIKLVLPAVMAMMMSFSAWARDGGNTPDMDILEYLGTYETERGREIDPMLLEKPPEVKPRSKGTLPKKKEPKSNEPRKEEEKDD